MSLGIRRQLTDDHGLTLVEILVAMVLLVLSLLALTSTILASLRATHANETRVRANALANEALEDLQFAGWATLVDGITDGDFPATDTAERDGITYSVTEDVVWVDDPSTSDDEDYLEFTVTITWDDRGISRTVTHRAFRAPPPGDPSDFAIRSAQVFPEVGLLKDNPGNPDHGQIDAAVIFDEDGAIAYDSNVNKADVTLVTTVPLPSDSVKVRFINRDGDWSAWFTLLTDDGTTWEFSGQGNWRFRNGDTPFEFLVEVGGQSATAQKIVRYVHPDIVVDEGPDANPTEVCLDDDRGGQHPVEITAHFRGLTIDDAVEVTGAGIDSAAPQSASFLQGESTASGAHFAFTFPEEHVYPEGSQTTVTMTGLRAFDPDWEPGIGTADLTLLAPGDAGYPEACES